MGTVLQCAVLQNPCACGTAHEAFAWPFRVHKFESVAWCALLFAAGCLLMSLSCSSLFLSGMHHHIISCLLPPEYVDIPFATGTQVFHLLNAFVCILRCVVFALRGKVQLMHPAAVSAVLLDLPGLLFFSTYTLLVLFWAEIYHQARSLPGTTLRPIFVAFNVFVYAVQIALWVYGSMVHDQKLALERVLSCVFLAVVSLSAAAGFLLYGGRLFTLLRRFPIESRGRKKKLREVGFVTCICAACFTVRAVIIAWSAFDKEDADLDVMVHPLLNIVYYTVVELIPSALVLYILRKLPPKRAPQGYHQIPAPQVA